MSHTSRYHAPFGPAGAAPVDAEISKKLLTTALSRGGDYADLFFEYDVAGSYSLEEGILKAAGRSVELRAGSFGHYRAQAEINGRPVDVLVDSGASVVVLSHEDAERVGLRLRAEDYWQRVSTANGATRVAPVMLDRISIGDISVRRVEAAVSEPGKLGQSLLGMTFLGRLQRVDMRGGLLILQE